jgi:hypothetical protein
MSNNNETRKPETKLPAKDKVTELQVEELEERIAPISLTPGRGK